MLPPWQPWAALALFGFLLHFAWELLQVPFYERIVDAPHWSATLACLRATGGDVAITLGAYGAVGLGTRTRAWLARPTAVRLGSFILLGLAVTVVLEALATGPMGRWSYAERMPTLGGVGLAPLGQWTLLPPLVLWLARRHLGWGTHPAQTAVYETPTEEASR